MSAKPHPRLVGAFVLGAIALVGFIWILRVYLRPSAPEETPTDT